MKLRERLWELRRAMAPSRVRLRRLRGEFHALRAQFKSYALRSLARQRALERELAAIRYPSLYQSDLDVFAEIVREGDMPFGSEGTVSVIITNYNYGRYLPEAVESVLSQTYGSVELVIVDDASTDGSPGMLGRLLERAESHPSSRVLLKHNIGLPAARNVGIRVARGAFVFILDADNRLLTNCIEAHLQAARTSDADAVYGIIRMFGPGLPEEKCLSDAPFDVGRLSTGRNYIDAMALFRRSALTEAGLYSTDTILYGIEDYELWLRFAAQKRRVEFVPTVLSEYRVHEHAMLSVAALDFRGAMVRLRTMYPEILAKISVEAPN